MGVKRIIVIVCVGGVLYFMWLQYNKNNTKLIGEPAALDAQAKVCKESGKCCNNECVKG